MEAICRRKSLSSQVAREERKTIKHAVMVSHRQTLKYQYNRSIISDKTDVILTSTEI